MKDVPNRGSEAEGVFSAQYGGADLAVERNFLSGGEEFVGEREM